MRMLSCALLISTISVASSNAQGVDTGAGGPLVCPVDLKAGPPPPDELAVDIEMRDMIPFDAFGFDLVYDELVLEFVECRRSAFTAPCPPEPCFDDFACFNNPAGTSGVVRIGGFSSSGDETPAAVELLCQVVFRPIGSGEVTTQLTTTNFAGDFQGLGIPDCVGTVTANAVADSVCPLDVEALVPKGVVRVPIVIGGSGALEVFGFDLQFDPTFLTFLSLAPSGFTSGWDNFSSSLLGPGVLRIGGFTIPPQMPADPDTLAYVDFLVDPAAAGFAELTTTNFVEDLEGVGNCSATITFVRPPYSVCPVGSAVFVPDGVAEVPIVITGDTGPLSAFQFDLMFDPTVLAFVQVKPADFTQDWILAANPVGGNRVRIAASSPTPEDPGDPETIVVFVFGVSPDAKGATEVTTTNFLDDFQGVEDCTATIAFVGPPQTVCPVDSEVFVPDGAVRVPIVITGWGPLEAIGFDVHFDPTYLVFDGVLPSGFTSPWDTFAALQIAPDAVRIIAFTSLPAVPEDPDTVAYMDFLVDPAATGTAEIVTTNFVADFEGIPDCLRLITFLTDCSPPHSVAAGGGTMCLPPLDPPIFPVTRDADTLKVPIVYEGSLPELEDWGLIVHYDPSVLQCEGVRAGPFTESGWDFCCGNCVGSDRVNVGAALGVNPPKTRDVCTPDTLAFVWFTVVDPQRTAPTTLTLDSFVDSFGPPNAQFPDALDLGPTHAQIFFDLKGTGDVNGFSGITPGDASCAAQAVLNFDVLPPGCVFSVPPAGPFNVAPVERYRADVDCNGIVSLNDAADIFDAWACGATPTPCLAKGGVLCPEPGALELPRAVAYDAFARDLEIRLQSIEVSAAEVVRVPLEVRGSGSVTGFGLDLEFPEGLEIVGIERATATDAWLGLDQNVLGPGVVRLGGYTTHGLTLEDEWTTLAYVVVRVREDAVGGTGRFALASSVDDLAGAPLRQGRVQIHGDAAADLPTTFALASPRPNPSGQGPIRIRFDVPASARENVFIGVYNIRGQLVRTLVDGVQVPGHHEVTWDARNDSGKSVAAGTYFYLMRAGGFEATRKLVWTR
jgi:hypothetical protein